MEDGEWFALFAVTMYAKLNIETVTVHVME